jgi:thiol-disulfide isomerase/thioredoxin
MSMLTRTEWIYILGGLTVVLALALVYVLFFKKDKKEELDKMDNKRQQPRPQPPSQQGDAAPTLVLFHAEWCPHCKDMMGDWDIVEKQLAGKVRVLKFESKEQDMAKHGVKGFPTIRFYAQGLGTNFTEYNGPRTADNLIKFALQGGQ